MPRKVDRFVIQSAVFLGVLLLILYINRPQSAANKLLAWTEIRYKSTTNEQPDSRGACPSLAGSKKPALVVARVAADGDASWIDPLSKKYHPCIYTVDSPVDHASKYLQVPANRGHEAIVYLTFIIDNYYHIPEAGVVFVHGSRWAWHNDEPTYDNAALLKALDVHASLETWGYHNLRCDWSAMISPWDARAVSDFALPAAFETLFGKGQSNSKLGKHDTVRSQCCAQFIVGRKNILQHSLQEYIALRQWLLDTSHDAAPSDDRVAGRILSYLWHILFIKKEEIEENGAISLDKLNSAACPRAADCYCRLYGICNLDNCNDGHCYGRYEIPPDFRIPDDWAATHS
ncbi:conserved hypothetical protein [Talaromyces stipitatus ATCC 10500]|uniref:Uncharacterized protein n=1 Tax=Talaromyces stipitatus (strain ATCC 10500 / CBS 375.48 / QM 6759 / NRRL 1006) TaxID=441959 RepID=B8MJ09_TALSN|nr:uncharacterized protein TSTA_051090 [Talaromyces stipitatus ATCC 10500]EED15671.1 conserved hypothetical protein [Talaromyces stipitatus ATCC 10500]